MAADEAGGTGDEDAFGGGPHWENVGIEDVEVLLLSTVGRVQEPDRSRRLLSVPRSSAHASRRGRPAGSGPILVRLLMHSAVASRCKPCPHHALRSPGPGPGWHRRCLGLR